MAVDSNDNVSMHFPLNSLDGREFHALTGSWPRTQLDVLDLYDFYTNPDKSDESDTDQMLGVPCPPYYTIADINKLTKDINIDFLKTSIHTQTEEHLDSDVN